MLRFEVAVEDASAAPCTVLSPLLMWVAFTCALVGIGGAGTVPAAVLPFALSLPYLTASGMRVLRDSGRCSPRPLAVAVLVFVPLMTFDATLGFPGEGPAGALRKHHSTNACSHFSRVRSCLC